MHTINKGEIPEVSKDLSQTMVAESMMRERQTCLWAGNCNPGKCLLPGNTFEVLPPVSDQEKGHFLPGSPILIKWFLVCIYVC